MSKMYVKTSIPCCHICEGEGLFDFLFASVDHKVLPKRGLLFKERICFKGSKFFPLRAAQLRRKTKKFGRVAFSESISIHLKDYE